MASRMNGNCCPASAERAGLPGLLRDLQRLSEDQESADVIFILGQSEEKVYAHRLILLTRCKSFQGLKRGEVCRIPGCTATPSSGSSPATIRATHFHPDAFRQCIQYIYTGKLVLQESSALELLPLAGALGLEELRAACEEHVAAALGVHNACALLAAAMEAQERPGGGGATSFVERCIAYIGENAAECVKTNAFLNLPKDALVKIISSDNLCLEEEDVWRCVVAWSQQRAGVAQPAAHWTEEERARVLVHLAPLMTHVRLLLIESSVFAEEVEPTGAVPMEVSLERYRRAALTQPARAAPPRPAHQLHQLHAATHDKRLQPRLAVNLFPGSVILQQDKAQFQSVINNWYGVPKQQWRLVYRASTHGYSAHAFHTHCDNIAPLVVLVQCARGEVCGGFTDVAWRAGGAGGAGGYIAGERAFLFALTDTPTRYQLLKKPYAICYHADCGPIFGAGADLLVSSECNSNTESYSNLPHSYGACAAAGAGAGGGAEAGPALAPPLEPRLAHDYNFAVRDYEVYALATPLTHTPTKLLP